MLVGRNAQIGGGSTFRLNIGRGLQERGHQVAIAASGGPMVERYRKAGLAFHWVPAFEFCAPLLLRAMNHERTELIHASNTTAGDVALIASQKSGVPLVVSLHNTIADHEARHVCLKEARRILVFDSGAAQSAGKFTQEFDTSKILQLPRPVEHRPIRQEDVTPLDVVYVARLSSRKGKVAMSLIEAFGEFARENSGARLRILGGGSRKAEVTRLANEVAAASGCEINVTGPVLDPGALLGSTGVLVGAGYAALEAVMQGRAVVGAGFNGYGMVTEENLFDAINCNFGDTVHRWDMTSENFLQALRTLNTAWSDPATRSRYWGLDRIAAPQHGIAAVAARLEAVYQEVQGA